MLYTEGLECLPCRQSLCHQRRSADQVVVRYCHSCENSMQWQRAVRSRLYSEWAREGYCNLFTLVHLSNLILLSVNTSNTLSLNGVYSFREQNNPHPPLSPPFKVGLFVVFYKWLQQWHYVTWRVWGRKSFIFLFWSWQNVRKVLQGKVSQLILSLM